MAVQAQSYPGKIKGIWLVCQDLWTQHIKSLFQSYHTWKRKPFQPQILFHVSEAMSCRPVSPSAVCAAVADPAIILHMTELPPQPPGQFPSQLSGNNESLTTSGSRGQKPNSFKIKPLIHSAQLQFLLFPDQNTGQGRTQVTRSPVLPCQTCCHNWSPPEGTCTFSPLNCAPPLFPLL